MNSVDLIHNLPHQPRILIVSQRQVSGKDLVANTVPYAFEDWIAAIDQADIVMPRCRPVRWRQLWQSLRLPPAPGPTPAPVREASLPSESAAPPLGWGRSLARQFKARVLPLRSRLQGWLKTLLWTTPLRHWIAPSYVPIDSASLAPEYDLLYCIFTEPWEVLSLRSLPQWRQRCKYAVCHFVELWDKEIDDLTFLKQEYAQFDQLYSNTCFSTEATTKATGVSCEYLPITVDAIRFCPYPNPPQRTIDVSYIGRRSPITHQSLLQLSQEQSFFYWYDTAKQFRTQDHQEHRHLLAQQLKRTRYFFANSSKLDDPCSQNHPQEFGWRFFEGLAAGTIVLGKTPDTELFRQYFNWPQAIINLPFHVTNMAEVLEQLEQHQDGLEEARYQNILNTLRRYDWLHIWRRVLKDAQLKPTRSMRQRQRQLKTLAALVEAERATARCHRPTPTQPTDWPTQSDSVATTPHSIQPPAYYEAKATGISAIPAS